MQKKEENLELTGNLHQEFEEMKKFSEAEDGVPYSTWTKACSEFCTILCC